MDLANRIRQIAAERYVAPARAAGKREFSIAVKDLMADAKTRGISPVQRTPLFCNSIQTRGFQEKNGVEVAGVDGPAKKTSTTVVVHYRVTGEPRQGEPPWAIESPGARAHRLTEKLRGLMKDEIAATGGVEGYLRWVRGDDEARA